MENIKHEINNNVKQKHGLRFFVIPDCTYEKAQFLARFRQSSTSSIIRELINEAFENAFRE